MLRSSWLVLLYLAFLGLGVTTPFVMTLGYVWVDTFRPQEVAWFILNELPVAMIMGAGAVLTYLAADRRSPPPLMTPSVLQIVMAVYMTASLLWAEVPDTAWAKWDPCFKAVAFAAFVPLVIRSRVQIEAFVQIFVFSLAANFVPFGLKVLISGGGYGSNLGLAGGNSGLAEGGQLSAFCLMVVPLLLFLGRHGQLIPRLPMMNVAYLGVAGLAIVTALGTYERSAMVGFAVLGCYMFIHSRRKFLYGIVAACVVVAFLIGAVSSMNDRASQITGFQGDGGSAMTRILVWKWTLGYVASHPFGGSFDAFLVNIIEMPPDAANPGGSVQHGRAYHSIYFEVLGELGWPGLAIFLILGFGLFISMTRLSRKCRKIPDLVWVADLANALQAGMVAFLSSAAFVGIAFQPPFWYFVSLGVCLRAYVWHAERAEMPAATGWRLLTQHASDAALPPTSSPGWARPTALADYRQPGEHVSRVAAGTRRGAQ